MSNPRFAQKKAHILSHLSAPLESYQDASPKGSVDEKIGDLIWQVNAVPELVTTSSCAGRVAVFADGHDSAIQEAEGTGGGVYGAPDARKKARGGRWLFVSHSPLDLSPQYDEEMSFTRLFGMTGSSSASNEPPTPASPNGNERFIHLKFEPMILHVLTSSLSIASTLLTAAQAAGFRESGCTGLTSATPMVAVRSAALALDCVVGVVSARSSAGSEDPERSSDEQEEVLLPLVSKGYLRLLAAEVNRRFAANAAKIHRLRTEIAKAIGRDEANGHAKVAREEDAEARRSRKREEGLARRRSLSRNRGRPHEDDEVDALSDGLGLV